MNTPLLGKDAADYLQILLWHPLPAIRRQGYLAVGTRDSNPHVRGTAEWTNWDAGWTDRMREEE
jgi:hypothetical protein